MSGWTVIFFISSGSVTVILSHQKQRNKGKNKQQQKRRRMTVTVALLWPVVARGGPLLVLPRDPLFSAAMLQLQSQPNDAPSGSISVSRST